MRQAVVISAWRGEPRSGHSSSARALDRAQPLGLATRDPVGPAILRRPDQTLVDGRADLLDGTAGERDEAQRTSSFPAMRRNERAFRPDRLVDPVEDRRKSISVSPSGKMSAGMRPAGLIRRSASKSPKIERVSCS